MRRLLFIISILSSIFGFTYALSIEDEFFYVYHRDGSYDGFMRCEIDSIVLSHYDVDSLYHEKLQTQVFYTKDKVYRIPLNEIVDVSFVACHEIPIEKIKKVQNSINQIFLESGDINEMAQHTESIEAMDDIEKAWVSDNSFFVKIKNGGEMSWMYTPDENSDENSDENEVFDVVLLEPLMTAPDELTKEREYLNEKKMCVINQVYNDEKYIAPTKKMTNLKDEYIKAGINVDSIYGEKFDLNFLINKLPEYNLIFLMTHGSRDYILTGHNFWESEDVNKYDENVMALWNANKVLRTSVKEIRNGEEHVCVYVEIHYNFIRDIIKKNFDNAILFNTSCSSLATNNIYDAFKNKGVRVYLGYNKTNRVGGVAGSVFFNNMLWGMSVKEAYESISEDLKYDYCFNSDLLLKGDGENLGFHLCPDENHPHMIDLGLPSGVKWACCNVEKDNDPDYKMPEGYGGYYAWGECNEKTNYSRGNYRYYSNGEYSDIGIDKPASNGISACFQISGTSYDVAHRKWGGGWKMPTILDCKELFLNTKFHACTAYGVNGVFVTGNNGRKIFLPSGGYYDGTTLWLAGAAGHYYLGSLCKGADPGGDSSAYGITFWNYTGSRPGMMYDSSHLRYWGLNIRPVFK